MNTACTSFSDFLFSISLPLGALLSAIATLVAARARSTSKVALQTSQAALDYSKPPSPSASVVVPPEVLTALAKRSSTTAAQGHTSTSPGKDLVD